MKNNSGNLQYYFTVYVLCQCREQNYYCGGWQHSKAHGRFIITFLLYRPAKPHPSSALVVSNTFSWTDLIYQLMDLRYWVFCCKYMMLTSKCTKCNMLLNTLSPSQMAHILQTTFWNVFSLMNVRTSIEISVKFVQLTINRVRVNRRQAVTWYDDDPVQWRKMCLPVLTSKSYSFEGCIETFWYVSLCVWHH